jgi:hypothetical protein
MMRRSSLFCQVCACRCPAKLLCKDLEILKKLLGVYFIFTFILSSATLRTLFQVPNRLRYVVDEGIFLPFRSFIVGVLLSSVASLFKKKISCSLVYLFMHKVIDAQYKRFSHKLFKYGFHHADNGS